MRRNTFKTLCIIISIQLRLRLFDAVITPTILYGLAVLPMSSSSLRKIQVVEKKMLRKMVGWIRIGDETWETTMRRMKHRVARALKQHPLKSWSVRMARYQWKIILRIKSALDDSWIKRSSMWQPNAIEDDSSEYVPHRNRGRPYLRWYDVVSKFCHLVHNDTWQNLSIDVLSNSMDDFIQYFCDSHDCN